MKVNLLRKRMKKVKGSISRGVGRGRHVRTFAELFNTIVSDFKYLYLLRY